jgi:hypothetical protein
MNKNPEPQQRKALGRGLSALLPARPNLVSTPEATAGSPAGPPLPLDAVTLPIAAIVPNPDQPRGDFDPAKLNELAQSIRANGIIQRSVSTNTSSSLESGAGEPRKSRDLLKFPSTSGTSITTAYWNWL